MVTKEQRCAQLQILLRAYDDEDFEDYYEYYQEQLLKVKE